MKKLFTLLMITLMTFTLSSCSSTFAGSLFFLTPSAIFYYMVFAIAVSLVIMIVKTFENPVTIFKVTLGNKGVFLIALLLNIILTPFAGAIFLILKLIGSFKK